MSFGGATGHMNKSIQSNRALHKSIGTNYERRKDLVTKKTLNAPITKRKTERKAVDSATLFASQQQLRKYKREENVWRIFAIVSLIGSVAYLLYRLSI